MVSRDLLAAKFAAGLPYGAYVATGTPPQRENWARFEREVALTDTQRGLVGGFVRRINVLALSGTWCGDCVQQAPMLRQIERANPERITLRLLDRDAHRDLADRVMICGGPRVPTVIFLNEDHEFVGLLGDRTLARYRAMAAHRLGASCPLPGAPVPPDEVAATLQDWVDEFERVHLLLRLSPKLRLRHGD
jgi:thiol-disulfide isomerase/thioredoxin